ncbi:DUF4249 family protein [Dawidia soli]|uniref:DUF4249 family protein n=1 Tax=Dawidia soli TaxID=2782352 RepID=A0AAP2D7Q3_9BACT|nr:DUF4249 family protein [Dawidia soli]MBT1686141.1 DUF4249 family protein [Dawidia soli]
MRNIVNLLFIALLFTGCEKVIDLDYKGNQSRLVIEGNINNEAGPYYVRISKSIGLSESGEYPAIDNAQVMIGDDGGHSETLVPQGGGTYATSFLEGVEGRTYTLTVVVEGQTYTARSMMPHYVPFDSLNVGQVSIGGDIEYQLIPVYTDPMVEGNNYRFVLSKNDKLFNQHMIQNDLLRNGLVNKLRLEMDDDKLDLQPGDRVTLTMQCVDAAVALYYTTLALMGDTGPGGGTTPNNPPGNISNGALGVFSAHTVAVRSVTIP